MEEEVQNVKTRELYGLMALVDLLSGLILI